MTDLEIRTSGGIRAAAGRRLTGFAAKFNSEAALPGFHEIIRAGAFSKSLQSGENIRALYHHRDNELLGSTRSGTLTLHEDGEGLAFELQLPDTSYGRDLAVLVERGDVQGCSFGFRVNDGGDRWEERSGGEWLRELLDVSLSEITVTGDPVYTDTSVALRSRPSVYERADYWNWLETCR